MWRSDLRGEAQFRKFLEIRFFATPHIFANGPHLVALTLLRATKTPSKLPRSHFSPKRRLVPYAYPSFDILWPIPISLFVSLSVCKRSFGLVYAQFWCHRPFTYLVWTVIPQSFQGYPKSWSGVISSASSTLQSQHIRKVHYFCCFRNSKSYW